MSENSDISDEAATRGCAYLVGAACCSFAIGSVYGAAYGFIVIGIALMVPSLVRLIRGPK